MANRMNDFVLQQLQAENQRLRQELDSCKRAIPVSEACKTLIEYTNEQKPKDGLLLNDQTNPYLRPPRPDKGCCLVQ
ncbi:hypothetical protein ABK040_011408 [Willaertia magna]